MGSELTIAALNRTDDIRRARSEIEEFSQRQGLANSVRLALDLSLEEWLSNILKYAYSDAREHEILIKCQISNQDVRLSIEDDGRPFDPLKHTPPDISIPLEDRIPGGLGIFMIRKSMDKVEYQYRASKNILVLTKNC